ncbi:MAG: hypothetical protein KAJ21_00710 [Thermoplasmatales archaeon]|nr:hypothetical protein [Thermoplasmatales archaeon]
MGSEEELKYINQILQKQTNRNDTVKITNKKNIGDIKEYKYLQYLVFKYCCISNAAL